MPNGVAFRDGALYVAEVNRVLRYDDIEGPADQSPSSGGCEYSPPKRLKARLEVHRFRPGWLAVCAGRRPMQRV